MYEEDDNYYECVPDELSIKMNEIIKEELNGRIKGTIEEVERYKSKSDNLVADVNNLRKELREINEKHKKEIQEAIREGERKFGLGFAVNDTVYYVNFKQNSKKCERCNGNGKVELEVLGKLVKVDCPHCQHGNVYTYEHFPVEDTITVLKFYVSRKDGNDKKSPVILNANWKITACLQNIDDYKNISDLYKTIEECQAECERKNIHDTN